MRLSIDPVKKIEEYQQKDKCIKCGDYKNIGETYDGSPYETCYHCGKKGKCRDIDRGGFAFEYRRDNYREDKLSMRLVYFKEGQDKGILLDLIKKVIKKYYPRFTSTEAIIPIPRRKNSIRMFHSPNKIGKSLEQVCNGDFMDVLFFNRETESQKDLSFDEKFKNVDGAISLNKSISIDRVMIVDDVFTTGATIMEAARVLKRDGIDLIYVFCIGRSEPYETQRPPEGGWPGYKSLGDDE